MRRSVWYAETLEIRTLLSGLQIQFDYSHDTNHFFDTQTKKDLLQQAANAFTSRIQDSLTAIQPTGDNTWSAIFADPATGQNVNQKNLVVPANTVIVYAGGRALAGSEAGEGGPGGFSASGTQDWLNLIKGRGQAGALLATPTDFGPWGGSITFDTDTNWFFGSSTTGLTDSQIDFLSVAEHELGHLLGFGTAGAFKTLVNTASHTFSGPKSIAEYGQNVNVPLDNGGDHWQDGLEDHGVETTMSPVLTDGTRKLFTALDYAGLVDLGWTIPNIAVDSTAPAVKSLSRVSPGSQYTKLTSVTYRITFSEKVTGVNTNVATDFALAGTAIAGGQIGTPVSSDGGLSWSIPVTGLSSTANGTVQLRLIRNTGIQDLAVNALTGGTWSGPVYTLDHTPPVLKSLNRATDNQFTRQSSVTFNARFSEPVTGVNANVATDFILAGAAASGGTIGTPTTIDGGLTWAIPVTGLSSSANGTVQVRLVQNKGIQDLAANALTGGTWSSQPYTLDHTSPSVKSINCLSPSTQTTSATSVTFLMTFSEAVTGVNTNVATDFALTGSAIAGGKIGTPVTSNGGLTWSIAVSNLSSSANGTVQLHFIHNTGIADLAGNALTGGTFTSQTYNHVAAPPSMLPVTLPLDIAIRSSLQGGMLDLGATGG